MGNLIDDYIKRVTSDAIVIGQLREEIDHLRTELAAAQVACYVLREVAPILYDSSDPRAIALCPDIESALCGFHDIAHGAVVEVESLSRLAAAEVGARAMRNRIVKNLRTRATRSVKYGKDEMLPIVLRVQVDIAIKIDPAAVARAALAERDEAQPEREARRDVDAHD